MEQQHFYDSCHTGNLVGIKELIKKINIHTSNESGFRVACIHEHFHIIIYLINLGSYLHYYFDYLNIIFL